MEVYNALQLKNGAKIKERMVGVNTFTQPLQFLTADEKDEDWVMHNLDWLEWQGIKQIKEGAHKMMKNYKLAEGTIDKADYMATEDEPDDINDLVELLSNNDLDSDNPDSTMELKFYPIVPTIINTLVTEFSKRNTRVDYIAVDDYSYNEIMAAKMADIEEALLEDAYGKLVEKMLQMGMDPNSPEAKEQVDPEALKRLPEIEEFYTKSYRTLGEQWAAKQHDIDVARFRMDELEETAFKDMLITDREFWHFVMKEDDYEVELWNPVLTFYHKSPDIKYISEGNWVGKIDMMTISDCIDKFGYILTEDQMTNLESLMPVRSGRLLLNDMPNDGSYYNPEISHAENLNESLQMKRWAAHADTAYNPDDIVSWIIGQSESNGLLHDQQMLRVTTAYWKTQRRIGYLTSIGEGGEVDIRTIDESYKIANNPIYHSNTSSKRNAETLVFGDHIEWVWINQVWGGRKIGPNMVPFREYGDREKYNPIYIGIEQNKIGPTRYQFKGNNTLYGCKVPIEGRVFTERNTKSSSLVDLMKPSQIGYNMVCNQIIDVMIDEIGPVVVLDQNGLPQHSMGEDWGKHNYAKANAAMKYFNILPLDTSLQNTENALNFSHFQMINLEQSSRLMTKVQMARFFKEQALEVVGFTPQRLGQQIGQTDTARGVEQAVTGSYAQTEKYFTQHSDHLMPRVHQMRTDVAQYYHSNRPSVRLQSMVTPDEKKFFEINGTDLLLIDLNVFCETKANVRAWMEKVQSMAAMDNTSGASIADRGEILAANSVGNLRSTLQKLEKKAEEQAQRKYQQEKEMQEAEIAARQKEKQMANDHEFKMLESRNRNNLLVAEIKSAGYGAMQDIDQNLQSDYQDVLKEVRESEQYQDTMNFNREKESTKKDIASRKLDIEEKKVETQRQIAQEQLKVAKENTTASEIKAKHQNSDRKK